MPASNFVADGKPGRSLKGKDVVVAGFYDHFYCGSPDAATAEEGQRRISSTLQERGLVVHEIEAAAHDATFTGIHHHHRGVVLRIAPARLWRLHAALGAIPRRGSIHGRALQIILGHIT